MSIENELNRLQSAKESIRTAVASKGIEIPEDATLDTYSTYIDLIEGGSGNMDWQVAENGLSDEALKTAKEVVIYFNYKTQKKTTTGGTTSTATANSYEQAYFIATNGTFNDQAKEILYTCYHYYYATTRISQVKFNPTNKTFSITSTAISSATGVTTTIEFISAHYR